MTDQAVQLQWYLRARKYIADFRTTYARYVTEVPASEAITLKLLEVLKFDLEAILKLQLWEHLDGTLQACLDIHNISRWDALADLVVVIHGQTANLSIKARTLASKEIKSLQPHSIAAHFSPTNTLPRNPFTTQKRHRQHLAARQRPDQSLTLAPPRLHHHARRRR